MGTLARIGLVALLSGCGDPAMPIAPPDAPDIASIELIPASTPMGEFVLVFGHIGAGPPDAGLVSVTLDLEDPPTVGFVARDGSFLLEPRADLGHVVRVRAENEGGFSAPIDLVVARGIATAPPRTECLRTPDAIEAYLAASLVIANACGEEVVVEDVRLRAPAAISILDAAPIAIPSGESRAIALEIGPGADEVVLLTIAGERRAVSVVGSAP